MKHRDIAALMAGIAPVIREHIEKVLAPVKAGLAAVEERVPAQGEAGPPGLDGKDGAPGRDGKDGEPGAEGPAGKDGRDGIDGKDGAAGRDGQPGVPGRDGKDGSPGSDGKDGRDGFSLEDFSIESSDDGRTLVLSFLRGDQVIRRELKTAIVLDRGVWREGAFQKGDGVSFGGSFFIAQEDTTDKPETSKAWRLAVKRGRDGRDGKEGPVGPSGPKGERGEQGQRGYSA